MKKLLIALLALGLILHLSRSEGERQGRYEVWRIRTENGALLTEVCEAPEKGDLYISADNRIYEVTQVTEGDASARFVEAVSLPDVSWLDAEATLPVSAMERRVAMYCTHSDESYEPSDASAGTHLRHEDDGACPPG